MSVVRRLATGGVALATACGSMLVLSTPAEAVEPPRVIFGLTSTNTLVRFDADSPGTIDANVGITGLQGGETLVGIDFRPDTGTLYGVGTTSRLYTVNTTSGAASEVSATPFVPLLSGSAFGVDFNPVTDLLRIVSEADQNLRVAPDTGLGGADPSLAYDATDVNVGVDPNVVASAHTNNAPGAATTTLYGIDFALNTLVRQGSVNGTPTSPNSGTLFTVGALGVNVESTASMDVADDGGVAYAALNTTGQPSALYTIDLTTGAATSVGGLGALTLRGIAVGPVGTIRFSAPSYSVSETGPTATITVVRGPGTYGPATVDYSTAAGSATAGTDYTTASGTLNFAEGETSKTFTIPLNDDNLVEGAETILVSLANVTGSALGVPASATVTIVDNEGLAYAVTAANALFSFPLTDPSSPTTPIPITGLVVGDDIVGIDFRPATGQLYAVADGSRLYTINTSTGAATQVGSDGAFTLSGTVFGVDFNPVADRIRVVSDADQNLRINPNDGTLTNADTALAYASGDVNFGTNPNVIGSAYTNSFAGAVATTLYGLDSGTDTLVTQNPPNNGTLNTVGPLGVNVDSGGFDVSPAGNVAFGALTLNGDTASTLFAIDLASGGATSLGDIDVASVLSGFALAPPGVVGFSAPSYSLSEAGPVATITVNRTGGAFGAVTVDYATSNGTATAGSDYTASSGTLTFADGDTTETFTIPITDDPRAEAPETIVVTLSGGTGGVTLSPTLSTAAVTIVDNDATFYALDTEGKILTFTSGTLSVPTEVAITGLQPSETLLGIDVRPANNTLYALGSSNRLYTLDPSTGAVTSVGTLSPALSGTAFGVDFNPTVDRLRVVSDADQNLRVDPATAAVTADTALDYLLGDPNFGADPEVVAAAYTNNVLGLTTTTLYDIDAGTDNLVIQNPPNGGGLGTVGALGVDTGPLTGLDIAAAGGVAFASLTAPAGVSSSLYTVALNTGAATLVGAIGGGATIRDVAVARPTTTFQVTPSTTTPVSGATISATVTAKLPNASTDTSYTGTPTLMSSDTVFLPGTCTAASGGVSTCSGVRFGDLGLKTLTAVDTDWGIGGTTNVTVQPTGLDFTTEPADVGSVGDAFTFVVTPTVGVLGATITGYTATRTVTVTGDSENPESAPLTCLSPVCTFSIGFEFSGPKTVQVCDNGTPSRCTDEFEIFIRIPTVIEEFDASTRTAVAGQAIQVGGFLVDDETGDPIAGQPVRIYAKTFPATTFRLWRTVTTDSDGFFVVTARMVRNTTFQAVFLPGPSSIFDRADSSLLGVQVRIRVTLTAPPVGSTIRFPTPLSVRGYTYPAKPGARALLMWRRPGGAVSTLGVMTVASNGTFGLSRPLGRGTYLLYVAVLGTSGNITGYSTTFTVRVV